MNDKRILFKQQVDNFAVVVPSERIANILFGMIENKSTFPLKQMGLVDLFNGINIQQTCNWAKISVSTYVERMMPKHLGTWLKV